ncbi:MAG: hypothetical protein KAU14_06280 [Thermoplasmata archaeon]|nr:hypothetical protein [Thermoplasmata archaeon]
MKMNLSIRFSQIFIIIIIVLSGIQLFTPPGEVEGLITPDVNVNVNPSVIMVDVSPRGTGIATSMATLTNEGPHQVTVNLNIEIEGYDASPQNMILTLGPYGERPVLIGIMAMLRSPYRVATGEVVVTVKSVNSVPVPVADQWVNTAGFQVQTMVYGRLILEAKEPMIKVWPGKSYKIKFHVFNEGNADDTVRLKIINREELAREGFSTALSSSGSRPIAPGEDIWMTVHIQTPKKFYKNDYYTVDVQAVSSDESAQQFDYSVTVWVWGIYVPGFDPVPALIALFLVGAFLLRRQED